MSGSGFRGAPSSDWDDNEHHRRKKPYFSGSTNRDFKSSAPELPAASRSLLLSERRVSGDILSRQRYEDHSGSYRASRDTRESRDIVHDSGRDTVRDSRDVWDRTNRDLARDASKDGANRDGRSRDLDARNLLRDIRELPENPSSSRDLLSDSATPAAALNSRSNSYSKDYRHGWYNKPYPSSYSASYADRSGAYGSFGGKHSDLDHFSASSSREPAPREKSSPRDFWRSEKPRLASAPRFNPNKMLIKQRSSLANAASSVSKPKEPYESYSAADHRNEHYDYDHSRSGRWSSYSRRSESHSRSDKPSPDYAGRPPHASRERPHSSSLSSSANTINRPAKSFTYPARLIDHYPNGPTYHRAPDAPKRALVSPSQENSVLMQLDLHGPINGSSRSPLSPKGHKPNEKHEEKRASVHNDLRLTRDELVSTHEDHSRDLARKPDEAEERAVKQEESSDYEMKDEYGIVEDQYDDQDDDQNDYASEKESKVPVPMTTEQGLLKHGAVSMKDSAFGPFKTSKSELEPIIYLKGCCFPLTKLDAEYAALKALFLKEGNAKSTQVPVTDKSAQAPVTDFAQYPFYSYNLSSFAANYEKFIQLINNKQRAAKKYQWSLWRKYQLISRGNEKRLAFMEEQLRVIHPGDDDATKELLAIDTRPKSGTIAAQNLVVEPPRLSGRRNRRHGDLVTTEAEFQEILKSLQNEENESPLAKAKRVAATIPDLIVDPVQRDLIVFMDSNNFVFDKKKWADRVNSDFKDTFTEKEHDAFCEAFFQYPKKFGLISQAMGGLRLSQECVIHYYMTKKTVNYKLLIAQYKKKAKKTIWRKKKKPQLAVPMSLKESLQQKEELELDNDNAKELETKPDVDSKSVFPVEENGKRPLEPDLTEDSESEQPRTKKPKDLENENPAEGTARVVVAGNASSAFAEDSAGTDLDLGGTEDDDDLKDGLSNDEKRKNISSYWRITETNEFPHLLNQYGSQWSKIAEKLATKSATMVRNQYQRKGKKYGWTNVVAAADQRLARKAYVAGENRYSNFDTTLIVQPQTSTNAVVLDTKIHVYDAVEKDAVASGAPQVNSSHISVSNLMAQGPGSEPSNAGDSAQPPPSDVPSLVSLPGSMHAQPVLKVEELQGTHAKSSIMSLLNCDSPVFESKSSSVLPPVRANIASLLNTPSSPAVPSASLSVLEMKSRGSNINLLLG